ncbi:hypothetical protein FJ420_01850 [Mesorhizobium sp. B3-1-3]|uniref:RNA ligase family protein n=1 Tax=unclassified Mesorhizobium TaxID=325217 RepID=UPI0011268A10|nr:MULTISPECIES: RNA ligase family protein [unclassified Mesorhizobium]TPI67581.1 hypothetical protein FJ424_09820 [Mesorhizobium sp. B3-1-8]TPI75627.1 hypothetical protein FJ420_01850 [Mesorhizobium sp. B3-1-3]
MDFLPFPKLTRLAKFSQHCTITEKIDGSNAQVVITDCQSSNSLKDVVASINGWHIRAGSRSRWITPGKETDNFGFAGWVHDNAEELTKLGPGQHFGEWYGGKIQCGYGRSEKRFALFNTDRWGAHNPNTPACCEVVPVLYQGQYSESVADMAMEHLAENGSTLVPGFMKPEGIVVYLRGPRVLLKKTFEFDGGKWQAAA